MMKQKPKKCKGTTSETRGFGCGVLSLNRTYGLCPKCKYDWATKTDAGSEWFQKQLISKKKKEVKEQKQKDRKLKQELNVSGAMRLADTYFSRYIRLYFSENGACSCYTCGKIVDLKDLDNGHYQKREHKATRYHINNCRPQCKTCNGDVKHNGKQDIFRVNLVHEIGEEAVLEIERLARTTIKANSVFYRETADTYRIKLNDLQRELKVKYW